MRVGFVGLGAMGAHMARNLHRAGLLTASGIAPLKNRRRSPPSLAAMPPPSLASLAAEVDALVLCVAADADVLDVGGQARSGVESREPRSRLLHRGRRDRAACGRDGAPAGVEFLDCPVSGGVEGARDGDAGHHGGGDPASLRASAADSCGHGQDGHAFGPIGSGQAAKATNQIMCAGIIEAVAEAMAFAHAQGLPLEKLVDTLGKGAGSSWYFVHRAPNMIRGSYPPGSGCVCMRRIWGSATTWRRASA